MTDNKLADALRETIAWAQSECPCREETPDPCPLCDATVEGGACMAVESIIPRRLLASMNLALAEHDAKCDYDYALPTAEPIPIRPDDLWTCPLPEHWRRAIEERGIENPKALDWIEQRARELAQEGE